jgi:hypothetical protein
LLTPEQEAAKELLKKKQDAKKRKQDAKNAKTTGNQANIYS